MLTLLSEKHKKFLLRQYRLRLLGVIMFLASALCIAGVAMLLPSFVALHLENSRLEEETRIAFDQISKKNTQGLSSTLKDIKSMLALVNPEETNVYKAIRIITSERPQGVSITSMDYSHNDTTGSITFQGVATLRSNLLEFQKTLQTEKMFESVDLPLSNLAKESNVKYSFTISGKF